MQRGRDGAFLVTHFTTALVAMQKNIFRAGMTQNIDAGIACDLFRAVAPKNNFFLQIEHTHADSQPIEDVAVGLRILKGWHGGWVTMLLSCLSAEIARTPAASKHCNFGICCRKSAEE